MLSGFDSAATGVQQVFKSVWLKETQRPHYYIRGQMFAVATYPDASHTRAVCSLDARSGVFDNNAPVGRYADP